MVGLPSVSCLTQPGALTFRLVESRRVWWGQNNLNRAQGQRPSSSSKSTSLCHKRRCWRSRDFGALVCFQLWKRKIKVEEYRDTDLGVGMFFWLRARLAESCSWLQNTKVSYGESVILPTQVWVSTEEASQITPGDWTLVLFFPSLLDSEKLTGNIACRIQSVLTKIETQPLLQ